jgi:murein L,D-transpeptidase YcbB/YkuD
MLYACSQLRESSATRPSYHAIVVDSTLFNDTTLLMPVSLKLAYANSRHQPLWLDSFRISQAGDSLLYQIQHAERWGLISEDYHMRRISQLVKDSSRTTMANIDVFLTDAYLAMRTHIRKGRVDPSTFQYQHYEDRVDTLGIFSLRNPKDISIGKELASCNPPFRQYHALKDSLQIFLAIPVKDSIINGKINKLQLAIERWRWHKSLPERYLRVNIPSFRLKVFEEDSVYLSSAVIVGKPDTRTPRLESTITSFIIYPYWHVPKSIAVNEILPNIQKDTAYIVNHRYDVLDRTGAEINPATIPWPTLSADNFPYTLRQRDGAENTLGIIKFQFQNQFNVYLHDTNGRRLFSKPMRALSHGCVRVQKAKELARYLVKDDSVYITPDDLEQYLSLKQKYKIQVVNPLPLFIDYFTCDITQSKLEFFEDIYGLDDQLLKALHHDLLVTEKKEDGIQTMP